MSYYEDNLSKWYVSANDKHSTFVNQIKDTGFKTKVSEVIKTKEFDNTFDTRFDFEVTDLDADGEYTGSHNEKFSVWYDNDPNRHKVYRLTPGENAEKSLTTDKPKTSSSGSGTGFKPNTGERGWFDSKSHDLVTLEEYKEMAAKDFSIRPLTAKEKTPNNFVIMEKGKRIVYLWIGKWMKPQNT